MEDSFKHDVKAREGRTKFDDMDRKFLALSMDLCDMRNKLTIKMNGHIKKVEDFCFNIEERVIKTETYKEQILQNSDGMTILTKRHQQIVEKFNKEISDIVLKNLQLKNDHSLKLKQIEYVLEDLPQQVVDCTKTCDNALKTIGSMHQTNKEIQEKNISLDLDKLNKEHFNNWSVKTEVMLNDLLDRYHKMQAKRDRLENWIDIYMPLKLQHQMTETLRVCIYDKKSRHMLGIVDDLIQKHLRERVYQDIGDPQMEKRCLDLIEKLKLEADSLTDEEQKDVKKIKFN